MYNFNLNLISLSKCTSGYSRTYVLFFQNLNDYVHLVSLCFKYQFLISLSFEKNLKQTNVFNDRAGRKKVNLDA